jgi:Fe-S oxidoreductase
MERVILALLILVSLYLFLRPIIRIIRLVSRGHGTLRWQPLDYRIGRFLSEVLFQSKIIRERFIPGLLHALVFWGFLAFMLETLDHFIRGFGGNLLGDGAFHDIFSAIVALFAVLVGVGMLGLAFRRFVLRPETLGKHLSVGSLLVFIFIEVLMVTYLLSFFDVFVEGSVAAKVNWWVHSLTILAFLVLIPQSKHLHLVLSPVTVFLKDEGIAGIHPLDFEKEEFGAEKLTDLHPHSILGAFTCVECGRCRDHCPATQTGKILSPKELILDLRRGLKANPEQEAVGDVVNQEALWQCTTCGACTTQCPVGIEHVVPILEMRRGQSAAGIVPQTLANMYKGLEKSGNPWSYDLQQAMDFLEENQVPEYDGHDILYWMGCMARFDAQYQKSAKAFMDLMKTAGLHWGVLPDETCTGDAARRSGNEFLFQALAEGNIENLNKAKPKTIVSTCPHCIWTLEEYKEMGLDPGVRIIHHTELLRQLLESGKLGAGGKNGGKVAYHDACYLSRYKGPEGVETPRAVLSGAGQQVLEAKRMGRNSFCCGAGGATIFTEETQGKRINHERTDELLSTGASVIATSCPFCRLMIGDAVADREREDVSVVDIAQTLSAGSSGDGRTSDSS